MGAQLKWKMVLAVIVIGIALLYSLPTFLPDDHFLQKVLPDAEVKLGLDLKGGTSLTLGVETEKAISNALDQLGDELRSNAREKDMIILRPRVVQDKYLQFILLKEKNRGDLDDLLQREYANQLEIEEKKELAEGRMRYLMTFTSTHQKKVISSAIDQAIKVIRNRIDQFGVSEPDIRKLQKNMIQVQLPGLEDSERAINLIKKTAHLEFHMVDEEADMQKAQKGVVSPDSKVYPYAESDRKIVLKERTLMTGEHISDAYVAYDQFNQAYVAISFDRTGARMFERVTEEHVHQRMAIVLDGKVYSAPQIQEKISGGKASISGRFTTEEAKDLAIVLRAGSLPAPIEIQQERSVGPALGQQSITQGVTSLIVGGLLVLIFTIIYYGIGGVIVDFLLIFNILIIIAVLAGFGSAGLGAALTLPGIAGIILIVGTAVDASVLIFERIREELRRGLSPLKAVDEGFTRATLTIVDANVTTIMAAAILYQFGTGPIRGFAVTLSIGVMASMFTSIFVSRIFFDLWLQRRRPVSSLNL